MATQAQVSDWISKTRQLYTDALNIFARYQALAMEARLTGRVVPGEAGVTTNLTPEQFVGTNAELDVQTCVGAFAALGATFSTVSDEDTALLFEMKA